MARCGRCGSSLDDLASTCPLCGGTIIPAQVERGLQPLYRPGDMVAGRFRIERILGSGTSGIVYGVHDANTDGRTALKILWEQVLSNEPALLRLRREIQAAQCAPNPYCAAVHDLLYIQGRPAILMEWVEGETLREKIRRQGALPWEEAAAVAGQVLQAMGHLHALGVIHRDIKSGNVLIAQDGTAKLGDFGLAKGEILGETLTQTGMTLGTPGYMAPEVIRGRPATSASDLYSLGAMLFEMLTGRMPYQGNSALEVASRQISESPPLNLLKEKRVPRWLVKVTARLLERDPADRFPSAKATALVLRTHSPGLDLPRRWRLRLALGIVALAGAGLCTSALLYWRSGYFALRGTVVDASAGQADGRTAVALFADGTPCIAYADASSVKFTYKPGWRWIKETVDTDTRGDLSMALDLNGRPAIAYDKKGRIFLAHRGADGWRTEPVDGGYEPVERTRISLKFSARGTPTLSFATMDKTLIYAYREGSRWKISMAASDVSGNVDHVFDGEGRPLIAYCIHPFNKEELWSARFNGRSWSYKPIDAHPGKPYRLGFENTLHAIPGGGFIVAYYDLSNGWLKTGTIKSWKDDWTLETVDGSGDVGDFASIVFLGRQRVISYIQRGLALKVACSGVAGWSRRVLDSLNARGVSMAADGRGDLHLAYYDVPNHRLKYLLTHP